MCILKTRPLDCHPPLALKLHSGTVLAHANARWHFEILVQAGIPEEQWAEVVAESGFVDPQGTFVAGHGTRILEGKHYFAQPSAEAQPSRRHPQKAVVYKAAADSWAQRNKEEDLGGV